MTSLWVYFRKEKMTGIQPFKPFCPNYISKTLPAAFDDSLSYLEMLMALLSKVNELVAQVNVNSEMIEGFNNQYEELKERMDNLEADVYAHVDEKVDRAIAELEHEFAELSADVQNQLYEMQAYLTAYTDSRLNNLQNQIDNIIVGQITVIDPTTGLTSPLQVVINNIYGSGRDEALTATEYDALDLTATAYDAYDITAYEYDTEGKTLLV